LPVASNPRQFISCKPRGELVVMDCPDNLVFNVFLDRCDFSTEAPATGCSSNPCHFNGKCIDMGNYQWKCQCPMGFMGSQCEIAPNFCASNPCGPNGLCRLLPPNDQLNYYCTCDGGARYGLDCAAHTDINPCFQKQTTDELHPSRLSSSLYVQCDGDIMHLRFCSAPLIYVPQDQMCEWVDPSLRQSTLLKQQQFNIYQQKQQQQQMMFHSHQNY
jgi:hypothetical protein